VKITVIATGFKAGEVQKFERVHSAAAAISHERTVSAFIPSTPAIPRIPEPQKTNGHSLEAMDRPTVSADDDLDVPAFIRKRGEN
jgi:hypothetical protein